MNVLFVGWRRQYVCCYVTRWLSEIELITQNWSKGHTLCSLCNRVSFSQSSVIRAILKHVVCVAAGPRTRLNYVTTVSRDIFGRAMPGTYFRAESAYFKREKDDSRDILTAFKDRRRFLDISSYEKQKKKISCHMHFKRLRHRQKTWWPSKSPCPPHVELVTKREKCLHGRLRNQWLVGNFRC